MITIITACYNGLSSAGAEAVRRCIMSVARLPFPHEHLIMDGASSDGSVEFIKGLNAPSLQIYSEKDSGIYDALNKGIAKAKGDYIYVLGLDDYIEHPEAMARVWQAATTGKYDIIISPVKFSNGCVYPENESHMYDIYYHMAVCHQGCIERKSLLQKYGGYDTSYTICADFKHLLTAILLGCKVKYIPECYAKYELTGISSAMKQIWYVEVVRVRKEIYPNGSEYLLSEGIIPFSCAFSMRFSGRSAFVRHMGECAYKKLRYAIVKTDTHKTLVLFGMPFRIRRHLLSSIRKSLTKTMSANSSRVRILYDAAGFDSQRYGGVTSYLISILTFLKGKVDIKLAVRETQNLGLHEYCRDIKLVENLKIEKREYLPKFPRFISHLIYSYNKKHHPERLKRNLSLTNYRLYRHIIKHEGCDLIHLTGCHQYGEALSIKTNKPMVVTVHDLIPDLANTQEIIQERKKVLERVDHVIAISQHTKSDLIKLYSVPEEKITVIHHGCSPVSQEQIKVDGVDKFLLYIGLRVGWPKGDGSFSDYKNFDFMVDAIAPYLKRNPEMKLFCTGSGFTDHEIERFKHLGIEHQIVSKFVSSGEMEWLYANAQAFIYPSRYEGFGMPIVDAFARGCPVVCCNSSCFPEVAGGAALYFANNDAEGLVSCLTKLEDPIIRNEMIEKGLERAKLFSWQKAADETLAVYAKMTNK